jgi:hypothetical protein
MAEDKGQEKQYSEEEAAEMGQPSNDPSVFHTDVEPSSVGQPTEEPRPQPKTDLPREQEENAEQQRQRRAAEEE